MKIIGAGLAGLIAAHAIQNCEMTNLEHIDSIHDAAVYAAMIEADLAGRNGK